MSEYFRNAALIVTFSFELSSCLMKANISLVEVDILIMRIPAEAVVSTVIHSLYCIRKEF